MLMVTQDTRVPPIGVESSSISTSDSLPLSCRAYYRLSREFRSIFSSARIIVIATDSATFYVYSCVQTNGSIQLDSLASFICQNSDRR